MSLGGNSLMSRDRPPHLSVGDLFTLLDGSGCPGTYPNNEVSRDKVTELMAELEANAARRA
jgi:hypothetical protein